MHQMVKIITNLPPPEKQEGTNLVIRQKSVEVTKGATGSPINSDEESKIIKAYLVEDEEDDGAFPTRSIYVNTAPKILLFESRMTPTE
jgi:hypothetical protein